MSGADRPTGHRAGGPAAPGRLAPVRAAVRRRRRALGVMGLVLLVPLVQWVLVTRYVDEPTVGGGGVTVPDAPEADRTLDPYRGYGTWVDVYDFAPSFRSGEEGLGQGDVDDMVRLGVETVYLQAAKHGDPSPGPLVDEEVLGELLIRMRTAGLRVVGWYLPRLGDVDRDLDHLRAIAGFEAQGHRFDGVAVDIEWTRAVPDHGERSRRLVDLSARLAEAAGGQALGAIVLPPVQTEVVNPDMWPGFPWAELAPHYDVWLPMGYWTVRTPASGYRDSRAYTRESVVRLRANLDEPEAPVHPIGGIGDQVTARDVRRFARAVREVDAVGASVYDWATLAPGRREDLARTFGSAW